MPVADRAPLIAVTGPDEGGYPAWLFTRWALARAGARAVRVTPSRGIDPGLLDGLVIGGGADVAESEAEPELAPEPSRVRWPRRFFDLVVAPLVLLVRLVSKTSVSKTRAHGVDRARDSLEGSLIAHARGCDMPVLGICRGAQLMNLAEGGSLSRNVHALYTERPQLYTVLPRREVHLEAGSRLRRIFEREALLVNCLHFHAVREPGRDLAIVAREPSGVPQAIEHAQRRFWIGVQWHPEYLPQQEVHQRLFVALVEAARQHARIAKSA